MGIEAELAAGFQQRVVDGAGVPGFGTAEEEPVLFSDGCGTYGILDEVVVDLNLGVFGVDEHVRYAPDGGLR